MNYCVLQQQYCEVNPWMHTATHGAMGVARKKLQVYNIHIYQHSRVHSEQSVAKNILSFWERR